MPKGHIFTFKDKIADQEEGATIGVIIADHVTNLSMVWWDRRLKKKLEENSINLNIYISEKEEINSSQFLSNEIVPFEENEGPF